MELSSNLKKYYKLPLYLDDYMSYIFDSNEQMPMMCAMIGPGIRFNEETRKILSELISGKSEKSPKGKFVKGDAGEVDYICEDSKVIKTMFIIRGWGRLIGIGGYNLNPTKAAEIQDEFIEYFINLLNNSKS